MSAAKGRSLPTPKTALRIHLFWAEACAGFQSACLGGGGVLRGYPVISARKPSLQVSAVKAAQVPKHLQAQVLQRLRPRCCVCVCGADSAHDGGGSCDVVPVSCHRIK